MNLHTHNSDGSSPDWSDAQREEADKAFDLWDTGWKYAQRAALWLAVGMALLGTLLLTCMKP